MKWQVIGPFDNTGTKGFDTVFPPEKEIELDATYDGKSGPVKWQPFESTDDYGKLDFNKPLGMQKEATGYAVTTFDSPAERDAELRLGCKNAWKVWLNGELLFGRDEYHRGQQMDQYKTEVPAEEGREHRAREVLPERAEGGMDGGMGVPAPRLRQRRHRNTRRRQMNHRIFPPT